MLLNSILEAQERERDKPKIRKARIAQKEREKDGVWIKVEDSIKPYYKFVPNKKPIKK
jgi:hypothetical protein